LNRSALIRVFLATWLAYAGFYLCRKNFSVAMPFLQNEGGLSKQQLADILFAYSLCYAGGQFLMGGLADRWKPRIVVGVGLGSSIAANLAMGLDSRYWPLLVLGMINGLAQATGWPSLVKTMRAWFPASGRGLTMAWWSTNYVLGGFLATLFASAIVGAFAWRTVFWAPALLLAVVTAVYLALAPDEPAGEVARGRTPRRYGAMLSRPMVWLTSIVAFLLKVIRYGFLYWLPLYLTERLGYRPEQAGYLSSAYELLGFAGAIAAGYASDKVFGGKRFPVASLMLAGLGIACVLHPRLAAMGWAGCLASITLIGFMTYGPDTLMQGAASQDAASNEDPASTAGFVCGVASLGQLVSPHLVAWVVANRGWDELFLFFVGIAAAGAALSALGWRLKAAELS
jgi:OPA family sugar phosphate sensor protein UhpC-like MFS transporter